MRRFVIFLLLASFFAVPVPVSEAAMPIVIKPTAQLPQVVVRENFIQLATGKLQATLLDNGETRRFRIEAVNVPAGIRLPSGQISYEVFLPNGLRYGRRMQVWINVNINGQRYTQVRCTMLVRVYEHMVVTTHQMSPEEVITANDVRLEEREVVADTHSYYTKIEDVLGLTPIRTVPQATVLYNRTIRQPVVMKQGDRIKIKAKVNGIEISVDGIARSHGRIGEWINVQNNVSGKIVRAKVVDSTTVLSER